MTVRIRIAALAAEVEIPPAVFEDARAVRFRDYLATEGELGQAKAQGFLEALVSAAFLELAEGWSGAVKARVQRVVELRAQLRARYDAVLEHFGREGGATRPLPPELQPEAFRGLFNDLARELDGIRGFRQHVDAMPDAELVGDIRAWDEARAKGPDEPFRPPDPRQRPQRLPGIAEQERVERLYYTSLKNLRPTEEGLAGFMRALGAADAWARANLPQGWVHWLERVPEYGAHVPAQRALGELGSVISAEGYGLVLRSPEGKVFKPDGLVQSPRGYVFAEWKEPLGGQPSGWYDSQLGRAALVQDLLARARMSAELPGCAGWIYDTGAVWLDELIGELVRGIRGERPLTELVDPRFLDPAAIDPALGRRIFVPRAQR